MASFAILSSTTVTELRVAVPEFVIVYVYVTVSPASAREFTPAFNTPDFAMV